MVPRTLQLERLSFASFIEICFTAAIMVSICYCDHLIEVIPIIYADASVSLCLWVFVCVCVSISMQKFILILKFVSPTVNDTTRLK